MSEDAQTPAPATAPVVDTDDSDAANPVGLEGLVDDLDSKVAAEAGNPLQKIAEDSPATALTAVARTLNRRCRCHPNNRPPTGDSAGRKGREARARDDFASKPVRMGIPRRCVMRDALDADASGAALASAATDASP